MNALGVSDHISAEWRVVEDDDLPHVARVSMRFLEDVLGRDAFKVGERIVLHGLPLRIVGEQTFISDAYPVMRDGWRARVAAWCFPLSRHCDRCYRRVIITLAVWGLARYDMGALPTWSDVYALASSAATFERAKRWIFSHN